MKFSTWLRAEWDRVAGFGLVGLGAVFVLLGYLGVRGTPFVAEQMAYMASGGIGGGPDIASHPGNSSSWGRCLAPRVGN